MSQFKDEESAQQRPNQWDHSTQDPFFEYYAGQSKSDETLVRFTTMRDLVLRALAKGATCLDVADLGCGAGTQSFGRSLVTDFTAWISARSSYS
jgi:2-polyprenyl-6-hydroxyphenyl methylase/3-demethylubiquinone-9 3-methyltransferase